MNHRLLLPFVLLLAAGCASVDRSDASNGTTVDTPAAGKKSGTPTHPAAGEFNVVLILTDDQGFSDLPAFGGKGVRTPNWDRLAAEGTKFTDFYVSQSVCTASRAALLTGSYANRVGMQGALNHTSKAGINPDELLLSEIFKQHGYATAIYGKWHLGMPPYFSPLRNGFDEFFGLPYSNDNGKKHPVIRDMPDLPLYEQDEVIELEPDQSQFTKRITEHAVSFIQRNKEKPFFLYVPHVMPHVPIFASDAFRGKSASGLYGDVIEELDWSIGQIMDALKAGGVDEKTLVIFASDNGPFLSYGEHSGKAAPLREGKLTAFDGGMRTACIMRWPGKVPAGGECRELLASIDLVPTFAKMLSFDLPKERAIDGKDVWPLIAGQAGAKTPHDFYFFYADEELHAVRSGKWKLHFAHPYLTVAGDPGTGGKPSNYGKGAPKPITMSGLQGIASRHGYKVAQQPLALYDLESDIGESKDVSAEHPDVVKRLSEAAEQARKEMGDALTKTKATAARPPGRMP